MKWHKDSTVGIKHGRLRQLRKGQVYEETWVTTSVSVQQSPTLRQLCEKQDDTGLLKRKREEHKEEEEKEGSRRK